MQQVVGVHNPLGLDVAWRSGIEPLDLHTDHAAPEAAKVAAIAADMTAHGWRGAPVVVWGDRAWTGTHRLAAWQAARDDVCAPVPCVELDELLDACGLDLTDYAADDETTTVAGACADLPAEVREAYGLDMEA